MAWAFIALGFSVLCVGASLAALRRVSVRHLGRPVDALRRISRSGWAQRAAGQAVEGSGDSDDRAWDLVTRVASECDPLAAAALLEEGRADVRLELARGVPVPAACARISLASGTACALFAFGSTLVGAGPGPAPGVACFAIGSLGALTSLFVGRVVKQKAHAAAADYSLLFGRLAEHLQRPLGVWIEACQGAPGRGPVRVQPRAQEVG